MSPFHIAKEIESEFLQLIASPRRTTLLLTDKFKPSGKSKNKFKPFAKCLSYWILIRRPLSLNNVFHPFSASEPLTRLFICPQSLFARPFYYGPGALSREPG